jgi:hypothetical protein
MTDEELLAEKVAKRLQGLKQFTVQARETCYYERIVWAKNYEEAEELANEDCDWSDPVDYANFEIFDIEEEACTGTTE